MSEGRLSLVDAEEFAVRDRRHSVEIEKRTWMCDGHDVGLKPELNANAETCRLLTAQFDIDITDDNVVFP